jgi:hypothetical protein
MSGLGRDDSNTNLLNIFGGGSPTFKPEPKIPPLQTEKLPIIRKRGAPLLLPVSQANPNLNIAVQKQSSDEKQSKHVRTTPLGSQDNLPLTPNKSATVTPPNEAVKPELLSSVKAFQRGPTAEELSLVRFVEKFKNDLSDINDKLNKEKRRYYIREYSRQLSEQMYSTVINWNLELRQKLPQEEAQILTMLREKFKPFISFKGFILPFVSTSKLSQDFMIREELDWSRRVYFLTSLDSMQTEQFDPIHRQMIRENNQRVFFANIKDFTKDQIIKRLIETDSPRLYLLAMQHGLLTDMSYVTTMLQKLADKLKQLFLYTDGFKRQTKADDPAVKMTYVGSDKVRDGLELLEEEGEKIIEGLEKFIKVNKRSDMEKASDVLRFLTHSIVLYNDLTFIQMMKEQTNIDPEDEFDSDLKYFVDDKSFIKDIKSTLFDSLVADNFECLLGLKDERILRMVTELVNCLVGDCNDIYGRSLKLLRDYGSVNFQKGMHFSLLDCKGEVPVQLREQEDTVKRFQNLITEIVEGRRGKNEFYADLELIKQLEAMLEEMLAEVRISNMSSKREYCRFYAVSNMIHLLLNLALMFTASKNQTKGGHSRTIIQNCLKIIRCIMEKYPPSKCMIFCSKEWFFVERLYQFYPCECLSLIMEAIVNNQAQILSSETKATLLVEFLLGQINLEMPKITQFIKEYEEYEDTDNKILKSISIWTKKQVKTLPSKREIFEESISVILMFRCLRLLLSDNTSQLLNRKYCVSIQKNCFGWLQKFVWNFLLSIDFEKLEPARFFIELKNSEEIQSFLADNLGVESYEELGDYRAPGLEICFSILYTLNTTCLYGRTFTSEQLSSTIEMTEDQEDYETSCSISTSRFSNLVKSPIGGLILAEISKLLSNAFVLEFNLVRQDYLNSDYLKQKDSILDSIQSAYSFINVLLVHFDYYVDHSLEGDLQDKFVDIFALRGILEPIHKLLNGVRSAAKVINNDLITCDFVEELSELLKSLGLEEMNLEQNRSQSNRSGAGLFLKKYQMKGYSSPINALQIFVENKVEQSSPRFPSEREKLKAISLTKIKSAEKGDDKNLAKEIPEQSVAYLGKLVFSIESTLASITELPIEKESHHYMTEIIENLQDEASTVLTDLPEDGSWNLEMFRAKISRVIEITKKEYKVIENESEITELNERASLIKALQKVSFD